MNDTPETITRINGNGQPYVTPIPELVILTDSINDVALRHIEESTGLAFVRGAWNYHAQPTSSNQVVRLLGTYNFKTQYHNNASTVNTIYLRFCNNESFRARSLCYNCVKENGIHAHDLDENSRLAI